MFCFHSASETLLWRLLVLVVSIQIWRTQLLNDIDSLEAEATIWEVYQVSSLWRKLSRRREFGAVLACKTPGAWSLHFDNIETLIDKRNSDQVLGWWLLLCTITNSHASDLRRFTVYIQSMTVGVIVGDSDYSWIPVSQVCSWLKKNHEATECDSCYRNSSPDFSEYSER